MSSSTVPAQPLCTVQYSPLNIQLLLLQVSLSVRQHMPLAPLPVLQVARFPALQPFTRVSTAPHIVPLVVPPQLCTAHASFEITGSCTNFSTFRPSRHGFPFSFAPLLPRVPAYL
jgi:hypothetical protein